MQENNRVSASDGYVTHLAVKDAYAISEMIVFGRDRHGIPALAVGGRAKGDLELIQSPEINALEAIRFAARLFPVCP